MPGLPELELRSVLGTIRAWRNAWHRDYDLIDEHSVTSSQTQSNLAGRVVLVAGGTGGLGSAVVPMLAAEGVRVVIGYANNAAQAERLRLECGAAAVACRADICSEEGRRALLDAAPELYGLVVMAGDPARGSDENTIRRSVEINFLAPILLARKGAE